MTENTTTQLAVVEPVVPEGVDCIDDLHVVELAAISRRLGVDVVEAIAGSKGSQGLRWDAFMGIAHAWAKRTDPKAQIETFHAMTSRQLLTTLRMDDDEQPVGTGSDDGDVTENPTAPAPA